MGCYWSDHLVSLPARGAGCISHAVTRDERLASLRFDYYSLVVHTMSPLYKRVFKLLDGVEKQRIGASGGSQDSRRSQHGKLAVVRS